MSQPRSSVTPTGKRTTFDYPLTAGQQQQHHQQQLAAQQANPALSTPISIQPRASPRATGPSVSSVNAGMNMAQSCPTFSWQPPPAPSARPRLASVDPPPMELPPSPPVFSPMQAEAVKGKKEESTSVALKKQIYSRSLSNYSSSAPTNVDYLSKFHPNLSQLDEAGGVDDSDEEEEPTRYKQSSRAVQTNMRRGADLDDDSPLEESSAAGGVGISAGGQGVAMKQSALNRVQAVQRGDDFSLSSGSPGHSILGSIAAGVADPNMSNKRRSLTSNKPPAATSPDTLKDANNEDDLQFSISLTDEQEGEEQSNEPDSLNLY